MTTFNLTCEAVEATLADYLDETLEPWVRESVEEHLAGCAHCTALAHELRNITREAAALPALLPDGDVWPRIAGRIGVPVVVSEPVPEKALFVPTTEPEPSASDASVSISESPVLAVELPVLASELMPLPSEPPPLRSEPPPIPAEASVPTPEPVPAASEPLPRSGTPAVAAAAPAYSLPLRREKRWRREWMGLAAAALVLVTAGSTFFLTMRWLGPARANNVASESGTRKLSSGARAPAQLGSRARATGREQVAPDLSTLTPSPGQAVSPITVSAIQPAQVARSPEDVVYDKEINVLQRVVHRQNAQLDTSTVTVIDKNLRTLDSAIAQIRAALKKDPESSLLDGQASRALEMKVELLRRAAMLRSNT
jgi:hypothetical protein